MKNKDIILGHCKKCNIFKVDVKIINIEPCVLGGKTEKYEKIESIIGG
ncbi:hypothetical protein [Eubacterium sp.]